MKATDLAGEPLELVHRDVSPENVLIGTDGIPRVIDFGIAKARGRLQTTRVGEIKGKLAYMAPEQVDHAPVSPRTDIYAAGVVLWEALARRRLFVGDEQTVLSQILIGMVEPASQHASDLPPEVDKVIERAIALDAADRFGSAREMARALATALPPASASAVGDWVMDVARKELEARAALVSEIERRDVERRAATSPSATSLHAARGASARRIGVALFALGLLACAAIVASRATTPPPPASSSPRSPVSLGAGPLVLTPPSSPAASSAVIAESQAAPEDLRPHRSGRC